MFGVTELLTWREQRRPFRFLIFSCSPTRTYKIGGTIPDWVFQRSNLGEKKYYTLSSIIGKEEGQKCVDLVGCGSGISLGSMKTIAPIAWWSHTPLAMMWSQINIARIAKAALQICPGKSRCPVVLSVLSILYVLFVLSVLCLLSLLPNISPNDML